MARGRHSHHVARMGGRFVAVARLRAAIVASGLSASAYARQVLIRAPRTVRRWLAGDSPIPQAVREFLKRP